MSGLSPLDRQKEALTARYPGWRIWYVPAAVGPTTWHGHRLPILNADSADELEAAIVAAERS